MTEMILAGGALPAPTATPERDTRLAQLTAMWIARRQSAESRRAYTRDLQMWFAWCERLGIHPLDARMHHVDAWIAHQREYGTGAIVRPGNHGRPGNHKVDDETVAKLYRTWKAGEASQAVLAAQVGIPQSVLSRRFKWHEAKQADGTSAAPQVAGKAAPASIARRVYVVGSWYEYLIRDTAADPEPLIVHNPAKTDAVPKVDKNFSPTVGLTQAEADRLIAEADADGLQSAAIIRLLLTNAYRVSVITNADITDLGSDRGHRTLNVTLKGGKPARDALPPPTAEAIDAYLSSRGNPKEGPLFVTRRGGRVSENRVFWLVQALARRAGIAVADKISPHSLRHTAITELLAATNGNVTLAQDVAHHATPATTQIYNRRRGQLDGHGAYVLGTRYGIRPHSESADEQEATQ